MSNKLVTPNSINPVDYYNKNCIDDVLDLLTWVNGYLSGRDGIDANKYTLNKAGIEKTLLSIVEVCKSNEAKRFLDVVPNIK